MGNDIERNHFKLLKDINKNMEDFIVQALTKSIFEIGKGSLGGDIVRDTSIGSVGSPPVRVPQNFKEFVHILMLVNIPEQLKKKRDGGS